MHFRLVTYAAIRLYTKYKLNTILCVGLIHYVVTSNQTPTYNRLPFSLHKIRKYFSCRLFIIYKLVANDSMNLMKTFLK